MNKKLFILLVAAIIAVCASMHVRAEEFNRFDNFVSKMDDVIEKEEGVSTVTRTVCKTEEAASWTIYFVENDNNDIESIFIFAEVNIDEVTVEIVHRNGEVDIQHYSFVYVYRQLEEG